MDIVAAIDYDDIVACFEGDPCTLGKDADTVGDGFVDAFVSSFENSC